jgi:hypothetical protein
LEALATSNRCNLATEFWFEVLHVGRSFGGSEDEENAGSVVFRIPVTKELRAK